MKALQIDRHGAIPSELREVPGLQPGPDEVKVRVQAAALNPSDIGSAMGAFPGSPLPRILGRDFAGVVAGGDLDGTPVYGSGGDLGITRDGTHAEELVIPRAAVAIRPRNLTAEQAAAVGVPFVTAFMALEMGHVVAGSSVIVAGAAGAVGRAAIDLARARGARVVALVRDDAQAARLGDVELAGVGLVSRGDVVEVARAATGGRGCDAALNGLGAAVHADLAGAVADGGRIVVYSMVAGREAVVDLFQLYRRMLTIVGLNTIIATAARAGAIFRALTPLFESGALRPPLVTATFPLAEAPHAYERLGRGGAGKLVLATGA